MTVTVAPPTAADKTGWRRLFDGYAAFYRVPMTDRAAGTTWAWIRDPAHEVDGAVARDGDALVGLAHFRRMPSPLRGADLGFLDDLYVDPAARGRGVGAALIAHVAAEARQRGWVRLRWITAADNHRARALYDRVGVKTSWTLYKLTP